MTPRRNTVTIIPATRAMFAHQETNGKVLRRAAGYARVSTGDEEQQTSYQAQVDYYTRYIKAKPELEFVDVYTDEGLSALSTKKRDGFNQMVQDALDGKIDLIITKSVSRFARNSVDSLVTIRKLKEKGVEVYFEKENIYTLDAKGELLITIMSSLAQEESRSISENVTWGKRKSFADGKVSLPYKQFLGYEKGEDGQPKIVEAEAEIIRLIYKLFLQGKTQNAIARYLTEQGIPTPSGKTKWAVSTVLSILQNEKYKGAALLQKTFTVDFLTKKLKTNEGEVQQYYVEESHPAIIPPETFDLVQAEISRRKALGRSKSGLTAFSGRIVCGDCGSLCGPKVRHYNTVYQRTVWRCNQKYNGEHQCATHHVSEETVKRAFILAFNRLIEGKAEIISGCRATIHAVLDTAKLEDRRTEVENECAVSVELMQKCVHENAATAQDQVDFERRYGDLVARYERLRGQLEALEEQLRDRKARLAAINMFLAELERRDTLLDVFDQELFLNIIDTVTIRPNDDLIFHFKSGNSITIASSEL